MPEAPLAINVCILPRTRAKYPLPYPPAPSFLPLFVALFHMRLYHAYVHDIIVNGECSIIVLRIDSKNSLYGGSPLLKSTKIGLKSTHS